MPLGYYAFRIEPASLRLTHYDVALDHAPHLKGLKIAVISDLHGGAPFIDAAKVARVVALTNQARPDLILLTGDLNGHVYFRPSRPVAEVIGRLKPLSAPLGVHAVIGNHDRWEGAARVTALLKKAGIPVLENAHAVLRGPSGPFYLVGVGDAEKKADDPELALRDVPRAADALCFTGYFSQAAPHLRAYHRGPHPWRTGEAAPARPAGGAVRLRPALCRRPGA